MIKINNDVYSSGYTHGGKFHADEVAATALLLILDPEFPIERGFAPPTDKNDVLIYDIGNGPYDHHLLPREHRENMVEYSAVGKLWRDIGDQFGLTEIQKVQFDYNIIQPIDLGDNTGSPNPFSALVNGLNLKWNDNPVDANDKFMTAVGICVILFSAWFDKARAETEAEKAVEELTEFFYPGIAVCEKHLPSECFPDAVKIIIIPSPRGGYQAMIRKKKKVAFPESWRGAKELPENVLFCHIGGHLACFRTKDAALSYCKDILTNQLAVA